MNDLENKLHFIEEESRQYKDYKPFFTDMWDAVILTGRHSLLSFEIFEVLKDLPNEVTKSIDQVLKNANR